MSGQGALEARPPAPLLPVAENVGPPSMEPTPYRVISVRRDTADTVTLDVQPVSDALADPVPGQFAMVWRPGVGETPISVSGLVPGPAAAPTWQFTVRDVGATTAAIADSMVGDTLGLRGPFGRGWSAVPADRPALVVAGGLGLAPLRMHVQALVAQLAAGGRAGVGIVLGARSPEELLFSADLERWSALADVHVTVDRAGAGWSGEVGLVTAPLGRMELEPGTQATVCGPEIMMRFVAADLVHAGLDAASIEVSMERSMACAVAHCGRCQIGPVLLCRDGPVLRWSSAAALMEVRRW